MKLAIFASGGGSNFQAIADACRSNELDASISLCVSDNPGAGVLTRARDLDIATHVTKPFVQIQEDPHALLELIESYGVTHIALAGFLRMIPEVLIEAYRNRIVNIHPALLPSFGGKGMYGLNVHRAVLEKGVQWTGVTIHFVDATYDTGPILLQHPVGVHPEDTPTSLAKRVLSLEHQIYPAALQLIAAGRVTVNGRIVSIDGERPVFPLFHPASPSH